MLEYYKDPAPGLDGMAAVARACEVPLATNMVVTDFAEFRRNTEMGCPVRIVRATTTTGAASVHTTPLHPVPHF